MLDALSCDEDRSDDELTKIIKSCCPSQVPSCFKICWLPNKITSWLTALLLKLPVSKQLKEVHMRSKLGHGNAGVNTLNLLESKMMTTSKTSRESSGTPSLVPLPWLSEKQDFQSQIMKDWLQEQSAVPCNMFVRPSKNGATQTHLSTRTDALHLFYSKNFGRSKTPTQPKSTKQSSHSPSSLKSTSNKEPSLQKQQQNLPLLAYSLQCNHANTSRFHKLTSGEQRLSGSGTSASSKETNSSTTITRT